MGNPGGGVPWAWRSSSSRTQTGILWGWDYLILSDIIRISLILSAGLKLQLQCSLLHELSIVSYTLQSWSSHLHCDQTLNQLDNQKNFVRWDYQAQDFLGSLKIVESRRESQWEKIIAQMGVSHRKTAASRAMQPENTIEKYSRKIQLRNTAAKYNWEIQPQNTI